MPRHISRRVAVWRTPPSHQQFSIVSGIIDNPNKDFQPMPSLCFARASKLKSSSPRTYPSEPPIDSEIRWLPPGLPLFQGSHW